MARTKTSEPEQLQFSFEPAPARKPRRHIRSSCHQQGFTAWCEREARRREICEPILSLHAAGVAFVAIVLARAVAQEVAR